MIAEVIDGSAAMIMLDPALSDLRTVLVRKFNFTQAECAEVESLLVDIAQARAPAPEGPVESVTGDPDDDLILATALAAEVENLVSGDRRHLVPLGERRTLRILTPQAFLADLKA